MEKWNRYTTENNEEQPATQKQINMLFALRRQGLIRQFNPDELTKRSASALITSIVGDSDNNGKYEEKNERYERRQTQKKIDGTTEIKKTEITRISPALDSIRLGLATKLVYLKNNFLIFDEIAVKKFKEEVKKMYTIMSDIEDEMTEMLTSNDEGFP